MSYLEARSNTSFLNEYHDKLCSLWKIEQEAKKGLIRDHYRQPSDIQKLIARNIPPTDREKYQELRNYLARNNPRLKRIAKTLKIETRIISLPIPALAHQAPRIPINLFDAVLHDNSYGGVAQTLIYERFQEIIGVNEHFKSKEFFRLINPMNWLKNTTLLILKIPFILIQSTSFNVDKFEDHFFGKISKLLFLIFIIVFLMKYAGFTKSDLISIFDKF